MVDRAGRTKRRGNFQPYRGKSYIILPLTVPLDDWATHVAVVCERPVGVGSPDWLRESLWRQGATEEAEGAAS